VGQQPLGGYGGGMTSTHMIKRFIGHIMLVQSVQVPLLHFLLLGQSEFIEHCMQASFEQSVLMGQSAVPQMKGSGFNMMDWESMIKREIEM
jgi:hypothetical protein